MKPPERRPWILEHDDAGPVLPGFLFAFSFSSRLDSHPGLQRGSKTGSRFTHRLCYRATFGNYAPYKPLALVAHRLLWALMLLEALIHAGFSMSEAF